MRIRTFSRLVPALAVGLGLAACAQPGDGAGVAPAADFTARATEVADAWAVAPGKGGWRNGFVPLQDLTLVPVDAVRDEATKEAIGAGIYRLATTLPAAAPTHGAVRFADGAMEVPLADAATAYRKVALSDGAECVSPPPPPPPPTDPSDPSDPDASVGDTPAPCRPLTVTAVTLGETTLRTSRGVATVPVWQFTIAELGGAAVQRVAVADSAVVPPPALPPADGHIPGLAATQGLTGIDGATVRFTLGVGACDDGITALFLERDDIVVLGGTATTTADACTEQLVIHPVEVTLAAPLGDRPLVDAVTGQVLLLTAR